MGDRAGQIVAACRYSVATIKIERGRTAVERDATVRTGGVSGEQPQRLLLRKHHKIGMRAANGIGGRHVIGKSRRIVAGRRIRL